MKDLLEIRNGVRSNRKLSRSGISARETLVEVVTNKSALREGRKVVERGASSAITRRGGSVPVGAS